jgi:hypothetical protein
MDEFGATEPVGETSPEYEEFSDFRFEGMDKYGCHLPEGERNELWIEDSPKYIKRCQQLDWLVIRADERLEEEKKKDVSDPEELSRLINLFCAAKAKKYLFAQFGIDDLTLLEDLGLRYFCQNFEKAYQRQQELHDSLPEERWAVDNGRTRNPALEAACRFLVEFCGVRTPEIPFEVMIIERSSGKVLHFLRGNFDSEAKIHQKNIEVMSALSQSGMSCEEMEEHAGVPYYFKYYLWRERQKRREQEDIDLS